jgi:flagellar basal body-associated protein FliL
MYPEKEKLIHKNNKRLTIIILIVIVFLSAVFGMIAILMNILPNNNNSIKKTATSSATVITSYIAPKAIASLSTTTYNHQSVGSATIAYKLSNYSYSVSVTTNNMEMFSAINKNQKNDSTTVKSQTTTFMKQNGLNPVKSSAITIKDSSITTYANNKVVCQLTDYTGAVTLGLSRYHIIACIDISVINQEYTTIEKLLTIYKKTETLPVISQITQVLATKDNIAYDMVNLKTSNGYDLLLFGAVDNNWEYIGNLSSGDQKYNTGKYVITPDVAAKVNNPKYKGFIATEIH